MPRLPTNTKCAALRCESLRVEGSSYCETHGGRPKTTARRNETNAEYKTSAWASIRSAQLSRMPICQKCKTEGRITQAEAVDHLFAWTQLDRGAFLRNRFQSLCSPCHSVKTSLERRGVFVYYSENGPIEYGLNDYARVCPR